MSEINLPTPEQRIMDLLRHVGDPGLCRGCKLPIWWVLHKNGKPTPYNQDGINHFITCLHAASFKKGAG
jgi:hypothetical protein